MLKTALFGAGQVGAMALRLLGERVCCVADNSREKRGTTLLGVPVVSPEESLEYAPERFCLCVTDAARAAEMREQLRALGYAGEIIDARALRLFDARDATALLLAEQINALGLEGDTAELGVYKGSFAELMARAFPGRRLHLFDTFEGFAPEDVAVERREGLSRAREGDFSGSSVEAVRARLERPELAVFHVGRFPESFAGCESARFVFVSLDADLYAPTAAALPIFYDRIVPGGVILLHDVNGSQYPGAGRALAEFCSERRLLPIPLCDLHASAILRKPL